MHDVLHRDARGDAQRDGPAVETQIGLGSNFGTEALHVVLHEPAQHQRQQQHDAHLLQNDEEGIEEVDMHRLFQHGEHQRNQQCRCQRRDERIGGHGRYVAAQLAHHDRCCRCRRPDDARQDGFPEQFLFHISLHPEDDADVHGHQQQLGHQHTHMPAVGSHLVEVDLTKSDKQCQEDKQREDDVEHRCQRVAHGVQLRHIVERQIARRPHGNGHRQRPVL